MKSDKKWFRTSDYILLGFAALFGLFAIYMDYPDFTGLIDIKETFFNAFYNKEFLIVLAILTAFFSALTGVVVFFEKRRKKVNAKLTVGDDISVYIGERGEGNGTILEDLGDNVKVEITVPRWSMRENKKEK